MGQYNPGKPVMPGMGGYGEDAPTGAYNMGQQRYTSLQQPQPSMGNRFGNALSQGLMAYGQGMTGQPFLTNYNTLQQDTAKANAERQYNIWKTSQSPEAQYMKSAANYYNALAGTNDKETEGFQPIDWTKVKNYDKKRGFRVDLGDRIKRNRRTGEIVIIPAGE